jgi:hypothetical protein
MLNVKKISTPNLRQNTSGRIIAWAAAALSISLPSLLPAQSFTGFTPGNLVVSRSVYAGNASTVTIGETLPPLCPSTAVCTGAGVGGPATDNGAFPVVGSTNNVWNNALVDGSFGITSPIFLDQITTGGTLINTLAVPTSGANEIATSFSSKSELSLHLSVDGNYITFGGYASPPNVLDVSNGNTPGIIDPTNPSGIAAYRAIGRVDINGNLDVTDTNAYTGDNPRGAIFTGASNGNVYFAVGNDNNGTEKSGTIFNEIDAATGVQVITPDATPGSPGTLPGGYFNVTEEGDAADKVGKDNNFRGITIFNNTLYVAKGSGSNGIDTVYQVGTAGTLPVSGDPTEALTISILPGFPTAIAKNASNSTIYPFGIWFANSTTLYVGDEGDGVVGDPQNSTTAGLQKWSLVNGTWQLDYVMQNGLNLGVQYGLPNYPPAINPATGGLRDITGRVNTDGTVTIWAITSTVSNNGDNGADPNMVVSIVDNLANTSAAAAAGETFQVIQPPTYGQVYRGVDFTPGTAFPAAPGSIVITSSALVYSRVSKTYNGTLTIENNSSNAISGPVTIQLDNLTSGVTFLGDPAVGGPQVVFTLSSPLAPGQSTSLPISFSDPTNKLIQFTPVVVVPQI